ncbi:MAG: serine/threonine protein kinase [Candidatus Zixiibacteriota bacterium]|nr:MAG: serine/threonine protein kinase [candidate division Zixibacteria bacterium]
MSEQLIGNYRILEKIGAGGMAKVYLAVHKDVPNLKVILKILSDSRLVERFRQEADKLALLDGNSNICRIKHFFNHGEDIVIAMEYIDGCTLDQKIKKEGRITIEESLRIIRDLLGVLAFAHAKGIYHRDIKPGNIMIDSDGNVKVIDFGIAKAKSDPSLTIAGTSCGTPPYMAPEQFTPSADTNYALIDVYAVGTTLYHMISGELPFKGENEFAIRDAKLFTDPPSLKEKVSAVSKQLSELVIKSLAKNPLDRFSSAKEMIEAVECIRSEQKVEEPTRAVRVDRKPRKKTSSARVFAVAAAVIVATVAVYYGRQLFSGAPVIPPNLLSPASGAVIADNTPTLHWQGTGASDYTLQYATDIGFDDPQTETPIGDTFFVISNNLDNGDYFWRVRSSDGDEYSEAFTFRVQAALETGTVRIAVRPSGDIYFDEELVARNSSGTSVELDAGAHALLLVNNNAVNKEIRDNILVAADTTISRNYTFRMPASPSQPPTQQSPVTTTGELTIGSKPTIGADIYIDGKLQELRKTPSAFRLDPGRHIIRVVLAIDGELRERVDTVTITAGGSEKIIFDFEK